MIASVAANGDAGGATEAMVDPDGPINEPEGDERPAGQTVDSMTTPSPPPPPPPLNGL